jgi:Pyruvate/2-oxoacid:ferredoxin oxidoreductase delta subunit
MSSEMRALLPSIDPVRCTDCRRCIPVCPRGAIFEPLNICCAKCVKYCMTLEVDCHREKPAIAIDRCDACGVCLDVCPEQAITWIPKPGRET